MRLNGKTALITGAATGIGFAIATAFLREGARVVLADLDLDRARDQARTLQADDSVLAVKMDVSNPDSVATAAEACRRAGFNIDVLVNNAGVIHVGTILETTLEDLQRVYRVNVEGVFNVTRAFLPGMIEGGGGVLLNMASLASLTAMHDRFAYSSSKAAVMMMTRSVALDFVKQNIRANCICPARVHTDMVDNYLKTAYAGREEETFRQFSEYQPVGRMIRPDEIAQMAIYLCSDESQMVTGSSFLIDGGVLMGV
ncbi:SDR family NAD(P)-dependent oxidoreductase [Castellaniella hirudinis]|uniref:SDR family NAD(P)-dependent oxidoreductase n=1 Tax=Castellaniella hirudinis TaxID=1144617 RepID=A0ABV8RVZ1_9BURK